MVYRLPLSAHTRCDLVQGFLQGVPHQLDFLIANNKRCADTDNIPYLPGASGIEKYTFAHGVANDLVTRR